MYLWSWLWLDLWSPGVNATVTGDMLLRRKRLRNQVNPLECWVRDQCRRWVNGRVVVCSDGDGEVAMPAGIVRVAVLYGPKPRCELGEGERTGQFLLALV